jgi:hypothetical protein
VELTAGARKGVKIIQVEVLGDRDCYTGRGQYSYRKIKTVGVGVGVEAQRCNKMLGGAHG